MSFRHFRADPPLPRAVRPASGMQEIASNRIVVRWFGRSRSVSGVTPRKVAILGAFQGGCQSCEGPGSGSSRSTTFS